MRVVVSGSDQIAAAIQKLIDDEAKKVATDLHAGLIRATPRDTGRAANGWQLEFGENPVVENQVPYIGVLNDGHSDQAPPLFVEAEIDRVTK